ncbi:diaminobutyrate acetyltransferase [Halorhodospira halophila]|uniref:L-2,4-diaminobutyric acid acetyltransferase n=1 Tax=Halorhodospira halophila (strain DSM 244 / SL1) TaxID=349124 RepID=A1WXT4_HALHL|nr:diaminobutyrate acetyltransferase [Halorhodospira halophila]ABM62496.1 diaminobutyrate acetyltransferase [Halorhodospira halophila SL1]MBK1728174.1 diaminobutyrate acetyltransferase [Halorhodospira halophila]
MSEEPSIVFRPPTREDGATIHQLVERTGVLDVNSCYLYLLLCTEFSDTCVVAEEEGALLGFTTGLRLPKRPESIFLWQIGIHPDAQGRGLGKCLVRAFLETPGARDAQVLETTISPSNAASQGLFQAIARERGAEVQVSEYFRDDHFPPGHESEEHYRIAPIR